MTMRTMLVAAAMAAACFAPTAFAADMPEMGPPLVVEAPLTCDGYLNRPVDRVWKPGQTASIVAKTCGVTTTHWLEHIAAPRREDMLYYYNGGSMDRTDINTVNVPIQIRRSP
jgi:hypothetical protein